MTDYVLIPRSTIEKTIVLLESLDSSSPTDLFVYLDILRNLKLQMHNIDIQVSYVKSLQINKADPLILSRTEFPRLMNQLSSLLQR